MFKKNSEKDVLKKIPDERKQEKNNIDSKKLDLSKSSSVKNEKSKNPMENSENNSNDANDVGSKK